MTDTLARPDRRAGAGSVTPPAVVAPTRRGRRVAPPPGAAVPVPPATPPTDRPAPFTAIAFAGIFGLVLPAIVTRWRSVDFDAANTTLAYLICLYSAGALTVLVYRGKARVIRMSFFVFCYVFMGLSVIAQVSGNRFPIHLPGSGAYSVEAVRQALGTVILGIVAFEVAQWASRFRRTARPRIAPGNRTDAGEPGDGTDDTPPPPAKLPLVLSEKRLIILGAIGVVFTAYVVSRTGLRPFFDSRQAAGNAVLQSSGNSVVYSSTNKASRGLLKAVSQTPVLISLFGMLYLRRHGRWNPGPNLARLGWVVLVLLVVANLILNNPIANSRFWFGTVAITLVSIYLRLDRAIGMRIAIIASIVVLLFGFTSLQAFRRTGGAQSYSQGFQTDLVTSGTYSAFTMHMIGDNWLASHDHTYGRQLAGSALIFVPRSIWTDKPVDTGNLVLPYANPAASLWTEGTVEAGPTGVILYFLLLGAGGAAIQRRFRGSRPGELVHAIAPIGAGLVIFVSRGSMLSVAGPAYVLTASILFITARQRPAPAAAPAPVVAAARPASSRPKRRADAPRPVVARS